MYVHVHVYVYVYMYMYVYSQCMCVHVCNFFFFMCVPTFHFVGRVLFVEVVVVVSAVTHGSEIWAKYT